MRKVEYEETQEYRWNIVDLKKFLIDLSPQVFTYTVQLPEALYRKEISPRSKPLCYLTGAIQESEKYS